MRLKTITRNRSRPKSSAKAKRTRVSADSSARQILLEVAKRLFARQGLSGTSIRDIAFAAKMNSSQISYYFESKVGLYRACIEDIAKDRITTAREILIPPKSSEEYRVRIRLFVDNLFNYFLEHRDTGLIIIREHDRTHSPAEDIFKTYFSELFELLIDFFKQSQQKKLVDRKGDPLITASLFFGMIMSELRLDHIKSSMFGRSLKNPSERMKVSNQIVELFD